MNCLGGEVLEDKYVVKSSRRKPGPRGWKSGLYCLRMLCRFLKDLLFFGYPDYLGPNMDCESVNFINNFSLSSAPFLKVSLSFLVNLNQFLYHFLLYLIF